MTMMCGDISETHAVRSVRPVQLVAHNAWIAHG
jgi:hypothetical protein